MWKSELPALLAEHGHANLRIGIPRPVDAPLADPSARGFAAADAGADPSVMASLMKALGVEAIGFTLGRDAGQPTAAKAETTPLSDEELLRHGVALAWGGDGSLEIRYAEGAADQEATARNPRASGPVWLTFGGLADRKEVRAAHLTTFRIPRGVAAGGVAVVGPAGFGALIEVNAAGQIARSVIHPALAIGPLRLPATAGTAWPPDSAPYEGFPEELAADFPSGDVLDAWLMLAIRCRITGESLLNDLVDQHEALAIAASVEAGALMERFEALDAAIEDAEPGWQDAAARLLRRATWLFELLDRCPEDVVNAVGGELEMLDETGQDFVARCPPFDASFYDPLLTGYLFARYGEDVPEELPWYLLPTTWGDVPDEPAR